MQQSNRAQPPPAPSVTRTCASKVIFVCNCRLFCGARRSGGLDFPGGKAQESETASACARRELSEEVRVFSLESQERTRTETRFPAATCVMDLSEDESYQVSLFVVSLYRPDIELTADGARELASPAWRDLPDVLADLESTRQPRAAGHAYAAALRSALRVSFGR